MERIAAVIEEFVRLIVDKPDQVKLEIVRAGQQAILRVIVDPQTPARS